MLVTLLGMFALPVQVEPLVTTLSVIVNEPVVHLLIGVTSFDASDTIEEPAGVVVFAIAVNVYGVSRVRLLIVQLPVEPAMTHVLVASEVALIV